MNVYQMAFLIFLFLPLILSIVIDRLTRHTKKMFWIEWYEGIGPLYMLEVVILGLAFIYVVLGAGL